MNYVNPNKRHMKTIIIASLLALLVTAHAQEITSWQRFGLSHLSKEDKVKVSSLITRFSRSSNKENQLLQAAKSYMKKRGYTVFRVAIVNTEGTDYLVVKKDFSTYITKDVPIFLNRFNLSEGNYFCKDTILGGISDLIDSSGGEHSFLFADWKEIR